MAIRVTTAEGLVQVGNAARVPLNPAAGTVGIAAGAANDLLSMQQRAETADRERKKFAISNAANEAIEQTQTTLLEIQDPEAYRETATKSYARIVDTVNKEATDDDMRMEVTQIIGARLRAARTQAAGEAIRKSGEQAWQTFQLSLDSGERLETRALAQDYFGGLQAQVKTLAEATLQPEAEVERFIKQGEGKNSDFRFYRDLALFKDGNFTAWEKVVKSETAFDERYPGANPNLRVQGLNQIETFNDKLFDRSFTSAALVLDNIGMMSKLNPVGRLPVEQARRAVDAAASVARSPTDQKHVLQLERTVQALEAHNTARDQFVVRGGAAPMQDELFTRARDLTSLTPDDVIDLTAKQQFLGAVGDSIRTYGSKATAAQFVGSTMLGGDVPAWNDPRISGWLRNGREVMGLPISPMDKGEFAQYQNTLKRGEPLAALEAVKVTRQYDASAKKALLNEMADEPIEKFEDQIVYGITNFPVSDVATMQAINGARSASFPKVENARAIPALESEMSAFYIGSNFDAQEFDSVVAVAKTIGVGRGMPPDKVEVELPNLLRLAVGYDEKTGNGGFTRINGVSVLVPPTVEGGAFEHKLRNAPISVLEQFANGPLLQGEDLKEMKTGADILDAGMHPVSVGGGIYRMMRGDREARVAPGGRAWEVNLDSFVQSYTPSIRFAPGRQPSEEFLGGG